MHPVDTITAWLYLKIINRRISDIEWSYETSAFGSADPKSKNTREEKYAKLLEQRDKLRSRLGYGKE